MRPLRNLCLRSRRRQSALSLLELREVKCAACRRRLRSRRTVGAVRPAGDYPLSERASQVPGRYGQAPPASEPATFHDAGAMRLDGAFGGPQVGGDLLVQLSGDDLREDFAFARRQRFKVPHEVPAGERLRSKAAASRAKARSTAARSSLSRPAWSGNPRPRACIAWTEVGMSPWPVRKMTGRGLPLRASAAWSSRPLGPGIRKSATTQPAISGSVPGQKFRGGSESLHGVSRQRKQTRQGAEHGSVVIHDIHGGIEGHVASSGVSLSRHHGQV